MDKNERVARELIKREIELVRIKATVIANISKKELTEHRQVISDSFIKCADFMEMLFEKYMKEYDMLELERELKKSHLPDCFGYYEEEDVWKDDCEECMYAKECKKLYEQRGEKNDE